MNSYQNQRRAEKQAKRLAELEAEEITRSIEERRKADLSMWERIEEAHTAGDLREVLHMMAERMGLE